MRTPRNYTPPRHHSPGVYFAWAPDANLIKIGVTKGLAHRRIKAIDNVSPIPVYLVAVIRNAGYDTEAHLHCKLASHRVRGEWFRFSPEVAWEFEKFMLAGLKLRSTEDRFIVKGVDKAVAI